MNDLETKELFTLFDQLIYSPKLEKEYVKAGFPNGTFRGVYALFNSENKALFVGSSVDLRNRILVHRRQPEIQEYLEEVVFIGIKHLEGDLLAHKKGYVRKLEPTLNIYHYYT